MDINLMEYEIEQASHTEKIIPKIKRVILEIEQNNFHMNKKIEYLISEFYHDFWFTQVSDKELLAKFNYSVGVAFYNYDTMANYKNALTFLNESNDLYTEIDIIEDLFDINNKIGNCYYRLGNITFAEKFYNLALNIISDNTDFELNKMQININMASINSQKGNYTNSVQQLLTVLNEIEFVSLNQDMKDKYLGIIYFNLAIGYLNLGDYEISLNYYKLGLKYGSYPDQLKSNIKELIDVLLEEDRKEQRILSEFIQELNK